MFDSDFDSDGIQGMDSDMESDFGDVENDTDQESLSETIEDSDLTDDFYHAISNAESIEVQDIEPYQATRHSADEVERVADMWRTENEADAEAFFNESLDATEDVFVSAEQTTLSDRDEDVEDGYYHASKNTDDITPSKKEPYHATRMSADEVERISDMWKDEDSDFIGENSADLESPTASEGKSFEEINEDFARKIESMSFEDLQQEQARLDELSNLEDLDIFGEYEGRSSGYDPELLNALTDGMPRESLERMRDGLEARDPEIMDYFGLRDNPTNSDDDFTRSRRK